jgi:hypothetical protein
VTGARPTSVTLLPVGRVRGGRTEPMDDGWDAVEAAIELDGARFGADAIEGTPVLDVKPHVAQFDARGPVRRPPWADELMAGSW